MTDAEKREPTRAWRYPPRSEHPDADVFIYRPWCKACGICYELCPAEVLTSDKSGYPVVAHPEACKACYLCEALCPEMAITVYRERGGAGDSAENASRVEARRKPERSHSTGPTQSQDGGRG